MRLADRIMVVTGGGSGIGAETVRALAAEGANTVSLDLDAERANASDPTLGLACDVTVEDSVSAAFDEVCSRFGAVHGAVPQAGHQVKQAVAAAHSGLSLVEDQSIAEKS